MPSSSNTTVEPDVVSAWAHQIDISESVARQLCQAYAPLVAWLAARQGDLGRPLVVGVNGAQGTGKSTLLALATRLCAQVHALRAAGLSLDDLYMTAAERRLRAALVHPLLSTRGVPGTHDVALGHRVLDTLTARGAGAVAVPTFDKACDDRAPRGRWPRVAAPCDVVILEGWCVGAVPEAPQALEAPVNDLERDADPKGIWRRFVNAQLEGEYAGLFRRIDVLVMLKAPDMDSVRQWRTEQEQALSRRLARAGLPDSGMDAAAVRRFVQYFERLTQNMFQEMPSRADVVIELDHDHRVTGVRFPEAAVR